MTTYDNEYKANINTNKDYKISRKEFTEWLEEVGEKEFFENITKANELDLEEWYDIAVCYSIPFIMIKWFIKNGIN